MDQSPLNSLPAELRDEIYHLVLGREEPVVIRFDNGPGRRAIMKRPNVLALAQTCKQIRDESLAIFHATNDFLATHLLLWMTRFESLHSLLDWLRCIGYENARHLRKLEIQCTIHDVRLFDICSAKEIYNGTRNDPHVLALIATFFAKTETEASLAFEVKYRLHSLSFVVSLGDLKAASLELHTTDREYRQSWTQCYYDGSVGNFPHRYLIRLTHKAASSLDRYLGHVRELCEAQEAKQIWLFDQEARMRKPERRRVVKLKMPSLTTATVEKKREWINTGGMLGATCLERKAVGI